MPHTPPHTHISTTTSSLFLPPTMARLLPLLALLRVVLGAGTPQERLDPEPARENYLGLPPPFGTSTSPLLFARQQPYVCTDPTFRKPPPPFFLQRESTLKAKNSCAVRRDIGEMLWREHVLRRSPLSVWQTPTDADSVRTTSHSAVIAATPWVPFSPPPRTYSGLTHTHTVPDPRRHTVVLSRRPRNL